MEIPESQKAVDLFDEGVAEALRRKFGGFDGLLGQLPPQASILLNDIVSHLCDVMLRQYSESDARLLLAEHAPRGGHRNATPVPDNVVLAMDLLHMIQSATRLEGDKYLEIVFGERDAKRQAGTQKPKLPKINEWIATQLRRDPSAKVPDLWNGAPEWITDDRSLSAFKRRVTNERKKQKLRR